MAVLLTSARPRQLPHPTTLREVAARPRVRSGISEPVPHTLPAEACVGFLVEAIGSIGALSREGRAHPVLDRRRHETDRLGRLRLLTNHQQRFGAPALARRAELFDLIRGHRIEGQVVRQRGHVAGLLPDDLGRRRSSRSRDRGCAAEFPSPRSPRAVCEMPHTLEPRLRAVRNSCTTSGARTGESSSDQHSSSTVMLCWPVLPDARSCMAWAIIMLMAVSSFGSSLQPSTLKNSQLRPVASWCAGRITSSRPLSPRSTREA